MREPALPNDTLTVSRDALLDPALDQQQLFALGLEHVRQLAHRVWTDHNVHDPGITTLELLSYALTDLSYRASFPLEDLLADETGSLHGHFFSARQILPMRPLTLLDYRKLVIDLPQVKNAWLVPAPLTLYADEVESRLSATRPAHTDFREVTLRGRWRVLVDFMDDVDESQRPAVLQSVLAHLHAHRNLCEDFVGASAVEGEPLNLCGELELSPGADVAKVQAELFFRVQQHLAPPVPIHSLDEMRARYTVAEIFEGPALERGFIDDEELAAAELKTEIRLSDLIGLAMDIEGVRAVRELLISPKGAGTLADKWRVPLQPGKRPTLDDASSRIVFYKRGMPVVANPAAVNAHRERLQSEARAKREAVQKEDLPMPSGRRRAVGTFHSFQNDFPALYGIGPNGLPGGATPQRRAQALQLQGYLLFFDQVMADYCAQLEGVRALFSTDPALSQTFFHREVASLTHADALYPVSGALHALAQADTDPDAPSPDDRRARFLDHLLARFAEQFHEYAEVLRSRLGDTGHRLIRERCELLEALPELVGGRAGAYDASLTGAGDVWDTENISGLERRVAALLGLPRTGRRNLSNLTFDIYAEIDETPGDEFRFRVRHRKTGKIVLSSSTRYLTPEDARAEMKEALHHAQRPAGYQRAIAEDGRHYFNIVDETGEVIARRIEYFDTAERMEAAIEDLMAYVGEHYGEEGMFVIENLLLLAEDPAGPWLPICAGPGCPGTDCADDDPYSYRLHVVLPAYAGRFADMEVRRFAESVIREETPAHLMPKICWVGREDMARVEDAYRTWLERRAGLDTGDRAEALGALRDVLYAVKNIYPAQPLTGCEPGDERPRFIVGRGALGSGTAKT